METRSASAQSVSLPLPEYNKLYEQAYLNNATAEVQKERQSLELARQTQEESFKQREKRLEEARTRKEREQRGAISSQNWLLLSHSVTGRYESRSTPKDGNMATFQFLLEFRVFDKEWTTIPLVDTQVITDGWSVRRVEESDVLNDAACLDERAWQPVTLHGDTLLLAQELDGGPERQVLAIKTPGIYQVCFTAYVFVHSSRSLHSLSLSLVHPIKAAKLHLKQEGASRVVVRELSISPAAHFSMEEVGDGVDVTMRLPSTKALELRWRGLECTAASVAASGELAEWEEGTIMASEERGAPQDEGPMQVTATHDALHTIMDGILQSSHTLKYSVDSEQRALTSVRFRLQGSARVTSVSGHGVMSWQSSSIATDGDDSVEPETAVDVTLKGSLTSDTVIVLLNTEMELGNEDFSVPALVCDGVLRQTGSLCIVKMANVEVHEKEAKGMARIGVDELTPEVKCQTNRPIMFAYKYITSQSRVRLCVIKHEQVGVLEAIAESALYEVLMSEGQSMRRIMLNMQNSRKQYLEVSGISAEARLWSLMVNSKPAKPVRGANGSLLVPLLVGVSGNSNDGAQSTSVEMAYLVKEEALGDEGAMNLSPPRLDVPISRMHVEVQWPETHEVKFKSSAQPVPAFSQPLPKSVNHDVGTDMVSASFDFHRVPAYVPKAGVNVQVPRAGRRYRFEQLLVVDGKASLTAEYHAAKSLELEQPKGWLASLYARLCSRRC